MQAIFGEAVPDFLVQLVSPGTLKPFVLEVCSAVGTDIGVRVVLSATVLAVDFLVDGLEPLDDLAGQQAEVHGYVSRVRVENLDSEHFDRSSLERGLEHAEELLEALSTKHSAR